MNMRITLIPILIRDLVAGFIDKDEEGVFGYNMLLNIRPKYQREFVYKNAQRDAVIETVLEGFPLNVMYWVKNLDGTFELLDGQQRTLSICKYIAGEFAINGIYFFNLSEEKQEEFLNYPLQIYVCEGGTSDDRIAWFKRINTAGEKLGSQELLNVEFTGAWLTDAKRFFSKNNCAAYNIGNKYLEGSCIRQEYLQTALDWISDGHIKSYMALHQKDSDAGELQLYFQNVMQWVKTYFPVYRKEMKEVPWGRLFNKHGKDKLEKGTLEAEVTRLMRDDDVVKKSGIYSYVLSHDEKSLNIRAFTPNMKREAYERQEGICVKCGEHFALDDMEADHITPWSKGGKTIADNCQMLCKHCNRVKSDK